jgi:hypothetical protein
MNNIFSLLIVAALAVACTPTVQLQAPDKPIEINLNVKIEQHVKVSIEKDVKQAITKNKDIF